MSMLEVPVLIVGGGGCGLTTSILLSDLGVDHLLVERHGGTSNLPKAHYLNQRTMEILREEGLAETIYAKGTPHANMSTVGWYTTLGGDGEHGAAEAHGLGDFRGALAGNFVTTEDNLARCVEVGADENVFLAGYVADFVGLFVGCADQGKH